MFVVSLSCFAAGAASFVKGDADGNGKLDIRDVTAIQRKLAGISLDTINEKAATKTRPISTLSSCPPQRP